MLIPFDGLKQFLVVVQCLLGVTDSCCTLWELDRLHVVFVEGLNHAFPEIYARRFVNPPTALPRMTGISPQKQSLEVKKKRECKQPVGDQWNPGQGVLMGELLFPLHTAGLVYLWIDCWDGLAVSVSKVPRTQTSPQ